MSNAACAITSRPWTGWDDESGEEFTTKHEGFCRGRFEPRPYIQFFVNFAPSW